MTRWKNKKATRTATWSWVILLRFMLRFRKTFQYLTVLSLVGVVVFAIIITVAAFGTSMGVAMGSFTAYTNPACNITRFNASDVVDEAQTCGYLRLRQSFGAVCSAGCPCWPPGAHPPPRSPEAASSCVALSVAQRGSRQPPSKRGFDTKRSLRASRLRCSRSPIAETLQRSNLLRCARFGAQRLMGTHSSDS